MATMVRCLEGHPFDTDATPTCPVCGSTVWRGVPKVDPKTAKKAPPKVVPKASPKVVAKPQPKTGPENIQKATSGSGTGKAAAASKANSHRALMFWSCFVALGLVVWLYRGVSDGSYETLYAKEQSVHSERAPLMNAIWAVVAVYQQKKTLPAEKKSPIIPLHVDPIWPQQPQSTRGKASDVFQFAPAPAPAPLEEPQGARNP